MSSTEGAQRGEAQRGMERTSRDSGALRRETQGGGPFSLMRRFSEDMDRMFENFFGSSPFRRGAWSEGLTWPGGSAQTSYWPEVEVHHSGDKLVVQADVPGLKKDDISVEVRDGELCISGERRSESERTEGGYYRSERSYGNFCRTIPLPQGAKPDTASATFENGVLKIEMEAAGGQPQGRRIEVREGNAH